MKIRWISTIVLIVMFFAVQGVGYGEDEQTCQPDVVVMFGNGVWNDVEDADESTNELMDRLEAHISGTSLVGKITYELAYNPSEGGFADFFETFEQNFQTEASQFWRFLAGLDLMPDVLQDKLKEIATEINADIVSANPSVQEHIAVYDQYLSEGNVVVLVAHSQGNLYGNIAYLGLDQQYIDGFGIVSVANPDSYVAGEERYTTIEEAYTTIKEDYIISPLQYVYPFALPPNLDNFTGPVNLADWSGHKFIESYMAAGHAAETAILDNVVDMINELSEPLISSCNSCIDFTADVVSGSSPLTVQFTNLTSAACGFNRWLWTFGDGQFSMDEHPTHVYRDTGNFNVTLKSWVSNGSTGWASFGSDSKVYLRGGISESTNAAAHSSMLGDPFVGPVPYTVISHRLYSGRFYNYNNSHLLYTNTEIVSANAGADIPVFFCKYMKLSATLGALPESGVKATIDGQLEGKAYAGDAGYEKAIPIADLTSRIGTSFDLKASDMFDSAMLTDFANATVSGWSTSTNSGIFGRTYHYLSGSLDIKTKTNYITVP